VLRQPICSTSAADRLDTDAADRKRLEVAARSLPGRSFCCSTSDGGAAPDRDRPHVAILRTLNRDTGLTILLIGHVMRAVMALASACWCWTTASRSLGRVKMVRDPAWCVYLGAEAV